MIFRSLGVKCNPRTGFCDGKTRFVPVELMDVAGLVEGASEGKGLGNQFLDNLRQADLFIHIVDASATTDNEGKEGEGDPVGDVRMLENELDKWYTNILRKVWGKLAKQVQQTKEDSYKAIAKQFSGLKVTEDDVRSVMVSLDLVSKSIVDWNDSELRSFANKLRHNTKPMTIIANKCDMPGAKEHIETLKSEFSDLLIIPCSADSELSLRQAAQHGLIDYQQGAGTFVIHEDKVNEKQKEALALIKKNVLDVYGSTGVQEVLDGAVFDLLKYIAVFPAGSKLADSKGNVLPDCFLLKEGSTALDFAFYLHTDIGNSFVKAVDVRTKMAVGKDHVLKHRDGLEIMTS